MELPSVDVGSGVPASVVAVPGSSLGRETPVSEGTASVVPVAPLSSGVLPEEGSLVGTWVGSGPEDVMSVAVSVGCCSVFVSEIVALGPSVAVGVGTEGAAVLGHATPPLSEISV